MAEDDVVNRRVRTAQEELQKRAKRLNQLLKQTQGKRMSAGFNEGVDLVRQMIDGHTKLIDTMVFDSPKTGLEQQRNLMLATGNMSQTVQEGIKSTTDAIDSMLNTLEQMTR